MRRYFRGFGRRKRLIEESEDEESPATDATTPPHPRARPPPEIVVDRPPSRSRRGLEDARHRAPSRAPKIEEIAGSYIGIDPEYRPRQGRKQPSYPDEPETRATSPRTPSSAAHKQPDPDAYRHGPWGMNALPSEALHRHRTSLRDQNERASRRGENVYDRGKPPLHTGRAPMAQRPLPPEDFSVASDEFTPRREDIQERWHTTENEISPKDYSLAEEAYRFSSAKSVLTDADLYPEGQKMYVPGEGQSPPKGMKTITGPVSPPPIESKNYMEKIPAAKPSAPHAMSAQEKKEKRDHLKSEEATDHRAHPKRDISEERRSREESREKEEEAREREKSREQEEPEGHHQYKVPPVIPLPLPVPLGRPHPEEKHHREARSKSRERTEPAAKHHADEGHHHKARSSKSRERVESEAKHQAEEKLHHEKSPKSGMSTGSGKALREKQKKHAASSREGSTDAEKDQTNHLLEVPANFLFPGAAGVSTTSFRKPSIILPILMEEEKKFHALVASGDVNAVKEFLHHNHHFNINCSNFEGSSALDIAVKQQDVHMVRFLINQPDIEVADAALYAIQAGNVVIIQELLDKLNSISPSREYLGVVGSPEFPEYITPMIVAAESDNYDVVGVLLERGHFIPVPHPPRCLCKEVCLPAMEKYDQLHYSAWKLHIYRSLASPAYICHTSEDPILTAFKLTRTLREAGRVDETHKRQYQALAKEVKMFAVELMAECRTMEEIETVLSQPSGKWLKSSFTYPRLILAVDYYQKEFVAHSNVQQVLLKAWSGNWYKWRKYTKLQKAFCVIPRIFLFPFLFLVFFFAPSSKLAKRQCLPVNRMLNSMASYLVFLMFVFAHSNVDKSKQTKETKLTGAEFFIILYVTAYVWNTVRMVIRLGPKRFFRFMWNVYEVIMEIAFLLTFFCWIVSAINTLARRDSNVERKYWHYLDPFLIGEGLFVIATIMAFLKILLLCQISYDIGPLQVSLGKMTNDVAKYSIIFSIIMLAFSAGLCRFYSYYSGMKQTNPDTGEESKQENSFTSLGDTLKTLFWGIFGMSSYEVADVVVENIEGNNINDHDFTEAIGYIVFAVYMVLTVILILNMLIATISNTFQRVTDNIDIEWVFGRTEVYLSYIEHTMLPPPFNLLPGGFGVSNCSTGPLGRFCQGRCCPKPIEKPAKKEEVQAEDFKLLMPLLVQRYLSGKANADKEVELPTNTEYSPYTRLEFIDISIDI